MKTVRTEETVEAVRLYVENNARKSAAGVPLRLQLTFLALFSLELRRSTFNKIMKQDLTPRSLTRGKD